MTARNPQLESQESARALERLLMLAGAGLLGFLLFQLLLFRFGTDQAFCAVVGDGLLQGEMPYRDRWCLRPPGIYPVYAAAQLLFGKNMTAIRIVETGALLSLFVAFPYFSRRHLGSAAPGVAGALLATLTHVQLGFWNTGQSEGFGGVALAWALLLTTWRPESRRRQLGAWLAAGALFTFAAMLKQPLGGGFVLCLVLLVRDRYRRRAVLGRIATIEPILTFGAGGAVVVTATLLPYIIAGAVGDLWWTFGDLVQGYASLSPASGHLLLGIWGATRNLMLDFSPYLLPGLVLWALLPAIGTREREGALFLLAAIAPQILGVALQAKFFPYHSGGMLHLVALWSGWGFYKLWLRLRRRPVWVLLLLALAVVVEAVEKPRFWHRCGDRWQALLDPERRPQIEDRLYSHSGTYHLDILKTAQWLRTNTEPEDRVFVWGPQAGIYFHSDRRPASRFIHNGVLRSPWGLEQTRKILERELAATVPEAFVVSYDDRPHWVTGHTRDSAESLLRYPWLRRMLETRYRPTVRFGRLEVYRLRDGVPGAG